MAHADGNRPLKQQPQGTLHGIVCLNKQSPEETLSFTEHHLLSEKKQIGRIIAGAFGLIGLGIIIAEVINSLGWFKFRLAPVIITVPMLTFYGFCEIKVRGRNKEATSTQSPRAGLVFSWMNTVLSLIGLIFLLSIPLLWWGVIKRLAQSVYGGG